MDNFLIIKTGAAGDVVRTTSLLRVLQGNIYWVTAEENKALMPEGLTTLTTLTPTEAASDLNSIRFTQVISLEEDEECARLASNANTGELVGVYLNNETIDYTENSSYWFDMSRISKLGRTRANELKAENTSSYQDCIFNMTGRRFTGETYYLYSPGDITPTSMIGIEKRAGGRWPNKHWWGYDDLIRSLETQGFSVKVFHQRDNIRDYIADIASCQHIVSGDSLAMHLALANNRSCTAIFNCTSPQEIYDYGLLKKIVSPLLTDYFYETSDDPEVTRSVGLEEVFASLPL
ncbi:MAG: hypothetical protein H7Y42_18335 [Chitinophagaceae bacterium]|nr:hypothetical protein [Chitinophagaceae bacterium]